MSEKKIKDNSKNNNSDKKYWGLIKAVRDKRQQYRLDQDYIERLIAQLNDPNELKVKEAKEALDFLNAFILAELDNNFKHLAALNIHPTKEFKKSVYSSNNAAQRDFVSNNQGARSDLIEATELDSTHTTMSDLYYNHKAIKKITISRKLKRNKKKSSDF